jgi:hypothetical protein
VSTERMSATTEILSTSFVESSKSTASTFRHDFGQYRLCTILLPSNQGY